MPIGIVLVDGFVVLLQIQEVAVAEEVHNFPSDKKKAEKFPVRSQVCFWCCLSSNRVEDGQLECGKMQFGCLTGSRGHNGTFCLRFKFDSEGSPLCGKVVYSPAFEVYAKPPFQKKKSPKGENSVEEDNPIEVN
jgi:hypothetical protein